MIRNANYAMPCYGMIAYGLRAPAIYIATTSDMMTGNDNPAIMVRFNSATADAVTAADMHAVFAAFRAAISDIFAVSDAAVSYGITPITVFGAGSESRVGVVSAQAALSVGPENRTATSKDSRHF